MSIPNKKDLVLLGNLTFDQVYKIPKWPKQGTSNELISHRLSVGGIGNIIESTDFNKLKIFVEGNIGDDLAGETIKAYLKNKSIKHKLHSSTKPTSQALIVSSLSSEERTSFVNWGCGADPFVPTAKHTRWTHISYLDIIPSLDLNKIRENSDIVSADLCLSNPSRNTINSTLNKLQYLDYLFASESEFDPLITGYESIDLFKTFKLKCLIFHSRLETIIQYRDKGFQVNGKHSIINNIDVLGAGDAYCGNFILSQLNNKSLTKSAEFAHQKATEFILNRKI